jgi:hypothetical protein
MNEADIGALEQALSLERFARYLAWAAGDRSRAVALYTLNTQLSECLYTPLQMLEIALRNRIHVVMSAALHDRWYDEPQCQLSRSQAEQVAHAKSDLSYEGKDLAPSRVVAALTFGYWTAFFNTDYENLWRHHLWRIVARSPGRRLRRKDFSSQLTPIRRLRNRIAHHEPILEWNLPKHYGNMVQLTEWLSPAAAAWCREHCRFDDLYPGAGIPLHRRPGPVAP